MSVTRHTPHEHNYSREWGIKRMETQLICHNQTFLKYILKTKLATQRKTHQHFEDCGHLEKRPWR